MFYVRIEASVALEMRASIFSQDKGYVSGNSSPLLNEWDTMSF